MKIKVVPVHIKTACRGRRDLAPFILNLRNGCKVCGHFYVSTDLS